MTVDLKTPATTKEKGTYSSSDFSGDDSNDDLISKHTPNTESLKEMDVDEILKHIGEFGRYQLLLVFLLSLLMVPLIYQNLSITFIGIDPPWTCSHVNPECNRTGVFSEDDEFYKERCSMKRESWRFVESKEFSIVTEWDLVCDRKALTPVVYSTSELGCAVGSILLGIVSDKFGRKRLLFPAWFTCVGVALASAFVKNFWVFLAIQFVAGILQGGATLAVWVLMTELVGPSYRSYSNLVWFSFNMALCLMSLQAWLIQKWRTLELILTAPYLILIFTYQFVPESVRWLRLNNNKYKAEIILHRVAKCNKKPWPDICLSNCSVESDKLKSSFTYIFYPWQMFLSTLVQVLSWLCIGLVYYGISISSDKLSGNLYTDFALVSLADVPANLMVLWLCNYFGRKRTTILSSVFGGLLFLILAFVPSQPVYAWVRILLGMTGKLLVNLSYNAIYIWSTELFPTSVRSKGIGVCTTVNIIGAALSPWVSQFLGYEYHLLPFIVMGGSLILSGLFCCVLSETKGKSTVETVEEVLESTL